MSLWMAASAWATPFSASSAGTEESETDSVTSTLGSRSAMRVRPLLVDDLGVDHLVVVGRRGLAPRPAAAPGSLLFGRGLLVELLGEGLAGVHEGLGAGLD